MEISFQIGNKVIKNCFKMSADDNEIFQKSLNGDLSLEELLEHEANKNKAKIIYLSER